MKKKYILILLITTVFTLTAQSTNDKNYTELGMRHISAVIEAPDFTLKDLEGNDVSLSDYKGQVVLLNFWASWCPPCKSEMPSMEKIHNQIDGMDVKMLAVNLGDSKGIAQKFIDEEGYTFEVLLDQKGSVGSLYGVKSIPTTYIINKKGELDGYKLGAFEWDNGSLLRIIKDLL